MHRNERPGQQGTSGQCLVAAGGRARVCLCGNLRARQCRHGPAPAPTPTPKPAQPLLGFQPRPCPPHLGAVRGVPSRRGPAGPGRHCLVPACWSGEGQEAVQAVGCGGTQSTAAASTAGSPGGRQHQAAARAATAPGLGLLTRPPPCTTSQGRLQSPFQPLLPPALSLLAKSWECPGPSACKSLGAVASSPHGRTSAARPKPLGGAGAAVLLVGRAHG